MPQFAAAETDQNANQTSRGISDDQVITLNGSRELCACNHFE
jgi:hypothetical protein